MKLWEVLKLENKGKKYKDNNGSIYELNIIRHNKPLLYNKYNDIANFTQYEVMHLEFAEVKLLSGWERAEEGQHYYYVNDTSIVIKSDICSIIDDELYQYCNYFSTKEKAEEVREEQELYRRMKKFYDENDGNVTWDNRDFKHKVVLEHTSDANILYTTDCNHFLEDIGVIYFSTRELAERCIDEVIKPFYARK